MFAVLIDNKMYILGSEVEAYSTYRRAGKDVQKIIFSKNESSKFWEALKSNL